ncbi:MAG: hypothetical protein J5589_00095 [Firmicutes bacterium]|nr:hypothetical protein [Bacillota bacterium]
MGLFKPFWMKETNDSIKLRKIIAGVRRISNQNKLYEIATKAYHGSVKTAAVECITDEAMLAKLALASPGSVGKAAVQRIKDTDLVYDIALRSRDWMVSEAAAEKIEDQALLGKMAMNAAHEKARRSAVNRIQDQEVLARIALESTDKWTADDAARRVRAPEQALRVAMSNRECAVHCAYVVSDPAARLKIALEAPTKDARTAAISKLDDALALRQIACGSSSNEERQEAVSRLKDTDALIDVLERDPAQSIRDRAVYRLRESTGERPLSDIQRAKLIRVITADTKDGNDTIRLIDLLDKAEDFWQILKEAARTDVQIKAFNKLAPQVPALQLADLCDEASARYREASEGDRWDWERALDLVISLMPQKGRVDLLMPFIRDTAYGCAIAGNAVKALFSEDLDHQDDIDELRDEAVETYLANIPAYEKQFKKQDEETCIITLATILPPAAQEKYGFNVWESEREDEDQYGRNTVTETWVKWQGKSYCTP